MTERDGKGEGMLKSRLSKHAWLGRIFDAAIGACAAAAAGAWLALALLSLLGMLTENLKGALMLTAIASAASMVLLMLISRREQLAARDYPPSADESKTCDDAPKRPRQRS